MKNFRYFLRVTVVRRLTDMTKELDLAVHTLATYPEMNNPIKMEVCGQNNFKLILSLFTIISRWE